MKFWFPLAALLFGVIDCLAVQAYAADTESSMSPDKRPAHEAAHSAGRLPLPGTPDLDRRSDRLREQGLAGGEAMLIRVFKSESELEVWFKRGARFRHFATYPICTWDGDLGPKEFEGDRQSPEGFYTIREGQLRWTGRWFRGLELSYPNAFDSWHGRTGSGILIHGGCGSVGCFAMTNAVMDEVFDFAVAAIDGGQARIPVHVFPFRLTMAQISGQSNADWSDFWRNLKPAHDLVELTGVPPRVRVCNGRYVIESGAAGYDGSERVREDCRPDPSGGPVGERIQSELASSTPRSVGRLMSVLAEVKKRGPGALPADLRRRSAMLGIRCNLRLPSCRKWAALHGRKLKAKAKTKSAARQKPEA